MYKYNININIKSDTLYNAIKADVDADNTIKEDALNIIKVLITNNMNVNIKAIKYIYDLYINHIR